MERSIPLKALKPLNRFEISLVSSRIPNLLSPSS
jgi:hypothetical protein